MKVVHMNFLLIIFLSLIVPMKSFALICMPDKASPDSSGQYIIALSQALAFTNDGQEQVLTAANSKKSPTSKLGDMLKAELHSKEYFDCAISYVKEYEQSKDESIKTSANSMETALMKLEVNYLSSADKIKRALNGEPLPKAGTMAEEQAKDEMDIKKAWEMVYAASAMATFSAVDQKEHRLVFSAAERDKAISILQTSFSKTLKRVHYLNMSATLLLKFLKDKWKTTEPTSKSAKPTKSE